MTEALHNHLRSIANARGLVLTRAPLIQEALHCSFEDLRSALDALAHAGSLEILSPLPYLVVALKGPMWSGKGGEDQEKPRKRGLRAHAAYCFQGSLSSSKRLKEGNRQKAPDEEALLDEILETLAETDPTTFRGAIRAYPPGVIRTALARIRRMKNIRKNPTALFRFLLPRIANEPGLQEVVLHQHGFTSNPHHHPRPTPPRASAGLPPSTHARRHLALPRPLGKASRRR